MRNTSSRLVSITKQHLAPLSQTHRRLQSLALKRGYHSYEHAPPPSPYSPIQSSILSAALKQVPLHGFTGTSLAIGAKNAGYLDITTNLFPDGAFEIVKYHLVTERLRLAESVDFNAIQAASAVDDKQELRKIGTGEKIRTLCIERLKRNQDVIGKWEEALALMSLLGNIKPSMSELFALADEMWFLAGDDSADMSWYTKRTTLAGVYASTELYMTQDTSEDFRQTWSFLDRRLTDVYKFGAVTGNVTQYLGYTMHNVVNVLRSKGVRI